MKKVALALVLSILVQSVPMAIFASSAPPPAPDEVINPRTGAILALFVGYLLLTDNHGSAPSAKASGDEFKDLNNNPAFKNLLNQTAGGSMSTLDILK